MDEEQLPPEEMRERKIMKLLLKIKNGTPPQRKTAMRQISDKAKELGADSLFNQILPLLMSPTLEVKAECDRYRDMHIYTYIHTYKGMGLCCLL